MDWWIQKQLRSMVVTDLGALIPGDYFEREIDKFAIDRTIDKSGLLSKELRWGYLAGVIGKKLFFDNSSLMTARQKSASELLMNLGILAVAEATHMSCLSVRDIADENGVFDENAGEVASQINSEQIPVLKNNVRGALMQYLKHLSREEANPFLELLSKRDLIKLRYKDSKLQKAFGWIMNHIVVTVVVGILIAVLSKWVLSWLGIK